MLIFFICGVFCNWMVFIGVVCVMICINVIGKVVVMWMLIMVFFYMGFEYFIVNMFFFLFGLMFGGNFLIYDYMVWNEILIVFGNLVGGLVFVGLILYLIYVCIVLKCNVV